MQQSHRGYNAAVSASARALQWEVALEVLCEAQKRRLQADILSFSSAITACQRLAKWRPATEMFQSMRDATVTADSICFYAAPRLPFYSSLWCTSTYVNSLPIILAQSYACPCPELQSVLVKVAEKPGLVGQWSLFAVNFAAKVLASFANLRRWKAVMRCFSDMQHCRLQDRVAHGTVLAGYAQCGQWQRVLHATAFRPTLHESIEDVAVGCAVAEACQLGRRWLELPGVLDVLDCLVWHGVGQLDQEKDRQNKSDSVLAALTAGAE